jgi:uroporphyrinogen decarboxylase
MTPKEVVLAAIRTDNPPYVPWHVTFTKPVAAKLIKHFGATDLDRCFKNHMTVFRPPTRTFKEVKPGFVRDVYGTLLDRTIDKDIGVPCELALHEPSLKGFKFPAVTGSEAEIRAALAHAPNLAVRCNVGFAMFERAWGLRGMENLLMDFAENPVFVHDLMDAICEHDFEIIDWALKFNPDIIHFGDDWGQQRGLIMGPKLWRAFIKPRVARLYKRVRDAGKIVSIHCCGDVHEIFDDLVELGVQLFNPFQPEVMDVYAIRKKYHGRMAFHGGMSIQQVLPFGKPAEVRAETRRLLKGLGQGGGYIFAPAHDIPSDVPVKNILAFQEVLEEQDGFALKG